MQPVCARAQSATRRFLSTSVAALLTLAFCVFCVQKSSPNGDLQYWYQIETCGSSQAGSWSRRFARGGSSVLPETACPAASGPAAPFDISLEVEDGFRTDASYAPVIMLPGGATALLSISVVDSLGVALLPQLDLELSRSSDWGPWQGPAPPAAPPPSPQSPMACWNDCMYAFDNACDDGGPK